MARRTKRVLRIYWFAHGHMTVEDPFDIWEVSGWPGWWLIRFFFVQRRGIPNYKMRIEEVEHARN